MTEMRILEILAENDIYPTDKRIAAMKQAVNEALEEAAENAGTKLITNPCYYPGIGVDETTIEVVDKESILNLKVR